MVSQNWFYSEINLHYHTLFGSRYSFLQAKQEGKGILVITHSCHIYAKHIPAHSVNAMKPNDGHIDLCSLECIKTNAVAYSVLHGKEEKK